MMLPIFLRTGFVRYQRQMNTDIVQLKRSVSSEGDKRVAFQAHR